MRRFFIWSCLLAGLVLVAGFVLFLRAREVPAISGSLIAQTSEDWGSIPIGEGECTVVNNMWNKGAAGIGFRQSVFLEEVAGHTAIGWQWHAPWQLFPNVISQPEIICGNKPWDPPTRPDAGFPFLAGTKHLTAEFDVNLRARGVYNMVFSLWAVSNVSAPRQSITHEIMIWTDRARQPPAGRLVDSMSVSDTTYDVYIEENQRDASGKNTNTWTYVAFVARKPVFRGPLDITAFIDYLLRRRTLGPNHYVTSLEFGNEICHGAGVTEIQNFSINLH